MTIINTEREHQMSKVRVRFHPLLCSVTKGSVGELKRRKLILLNSTNPLDIAESQTTFRIKFTRKLQSRHSLANMYSD